MACRGEKPREFSQSNFSYSGPMTANIQLGNLCARAGKKLELNEAGRDHQRPKPSTTSPGASPARVGAHSRRTSRSTTTSLWTPMAGRESGQPIFLSSTRGSAFEISLPGVLMRFQ